MGKYYFDYFRGYLTFEVVDGSEKAVGGQKAKCVEQKFELFSEESGEGEEGGEDGEESGGGVRLPLQGGVDRRLGSGQIQPPFPLHPQRVLPGVQVHHRR